MQVVRPLLAVALVAALARPLAAQGRGFEPESLVNTKVFPHNTPVREVVDAMRGFTGALGVRCDYCHFEREGASAGGPPQLDFPRDGKRTKATARLMLEMVRRINDSTLSRIPERPTPAVAVTCNTCHRGVPRPVPLADLIGGTVTASGLDSAVRAYRALRTAYFGRAAYDFGEMTLITVAQNLLTARRADDALGILAVETEFFPQSARAQDQAAEAYVQKGDTGTAVARLRQALQLDPNDRFAQMRLRALGRN